MIAPIKYRIYMMCFLMFFLFSRESFSQQVGMSFSFFFPKNGYFSTPVSPFSLRGIGIHPTKFFSIESGFSLYRMSGMNVTELPFESKDPLMGPMFSIFVPLEGVLEASAGNLVFRAKGGGFAFYNFDNHVNYGNLDRAMARHYQWEIANANLDYDNKIGFGYMVGAEIIVYFTKQFGINLEVNYLVGGADLGLHGKVTGGNTIDGIETIEVDYPESRLDFTGWEITIGILFNTKK